MKTNKNQIVKKECHSRGMLSGIFLIPSRCSNLIKANTLNYNNEQAGDPRQKPSGMTALFNNGGFTLIELLVVVLIIGILAAVAVPQYQKAVKKTYLAEWATYFNGYAKAIDVWLLSNGYPTDGNVIEFTGTSTSPNIHADLDLDFTCDPLSSQCSTEIGGFHCGCQNNTCWINLRAWKDYKLLKFDESFNVNRTSSEHAWMLHSIVSSNLQTKKLLCQYWKEHYGVDRMRESAQNTCASVGIE